MVRAMEQYERSENSMIRRLRTAIAEFKWARQDPPLTMRQALLYAWHIFREGV